jgi:hypothetical protein
VAVQKTVVTGKNVDKIVIGKIIAKQNYYQQGSNKKE